MQRGSQPVGPRKDDEMKHELEGYLRSGQHTHVEEGNDPEPPADDDIQVDASGPVPPPGAERDRAEAYADMESLRLEMARHLERTAFPADRQTVLDVLRGHHAPDTVHRGRAAAAGRRYVRERHGGCRSRHRRPSPGGVTQRRARTVRF
ncbi:DUF2795 domain-containing protein [Streptomyces sp. NPDC096323]|uniref:DUF2795 domain-containing protein n=1 Tax=Streptomyces sp. NPDC096323 TaxID=3155822 RepID=UPI003332AD42